MTQAVFTGATLKVNGVNVVLPYPAIDGFMSRGIIVVLLDPDANMGKTGQYRNLLAYDATGEKLWEADLPTSKPSDVYWKIVNREPLIVYSFSSYECEIDLATGVIVRCDFYK
jgi:hypothetical protein